MILVLLLLQHFSGALAQRGDGNTKATIQGVVLQAAITTPVAGARIILINTAASSDLSSALLVQSQAVPTATTDAQGRFVFDDVEPGSYILISYSANFEPIDDGISGLQCGAPPLIRSTQTADPASIRNRNLQTNWVLLHW